MLPDIRKIDIPFAIDMIAQKFDNILELIHPSAFVYGGCLRDIIAGFTLEGDLDIVATGKNYDYCYSNIIGCGKWRVIRNDVDGLLRRINNKENYRINKAIGSLTSFETFGNNRVDLVKAATPFSGNYITSSLEVIKTVDIVCCGIAMDIYGNAFEVIEGAHQDCIDRVLRINNLNSTTSIENLKDRIAKLERRGWTSKINIDKTAKMLSKIEEAAKKESKEKTKLTKKSDLQGVSFKIMSYKGAVLILIRNIDPKVLNYNIMDEIVRTVLDDHNCRTAIKLKATLNGIDITINTGGKEIDYVKKVAAFVVSKLREYIISSKVQPNKETNMGGLVRGHKVGTLRRSARSPSDYKSDYKSYFERVSGKRSMQEAPNVEEKPKTLNWDSISDTRDVRDDEASEDIERVAPEEIMWNSDPSTPYFDGLHVHNNAIDQHVHTVDQIEVSELGREQPEYLTSAKFFNDPPEENQGLEDVFDFKVEKKATHTAVTKAAIRRLTKSGKFR